MEPDNFLTPLPWHHTLWRQCYKAAKAAKLHHALLLQSPAGSGKSTFIKAFAKLILCTNPRWVENDDLYQSCETCAACLWYTANTHPNYYEIIPSLSGANKAFISIEQIRDLTQALQSTAMNHASSEGFDYHTVVVIDPVDVLQVQAVHALLKTLEEPISGVLFILASAKPQALAATIKSRCQSLILPERSDALPIDWLKSELLKTNTSFDEDLITISLKMAQNTPLKALHYLKTNEIEAYRLIISSLIALRLGAQHPPEVVQKWLDYPIEKVLDYLMLAIAQLVKLQVSKENIEVSVLGITEEELKQFSLCTKANFLFQYWDKLNNTRYETNLYTLNPTLTLESLAYAFSSSFNLT